MKVEQIYTGCLAEAAYYIESNGEAAIIDPLRDIAVYLELATERKTKIKYIFETHFHADFVFTSKSFIFSSLPCTSNISCAIIIFNLHKR